MVSLHFFSLPFSKIGCLSFSDFRFLAAQEKVQAPWFCHQSHVAFFSVVFKGTSKVSPTMLNLIGFVEHQNEIMEVSLKVMVLASLSLSTLGNLGRLFSCLVST